MVNLVVVDKKFDFGKQSDAISSNSYLTKIIVEEPNNLFNFTIESQGQIDEYDILVKCCKYVVIELNDIKEAINKIYNTTDSAL